MDPKEIKSLIEAGNRQIEAIRSDIDAVKSGDSLAKEKLAKMEADLASTLSAKSAAEAQLKALEDRLTDVETKANRPGAAGSTQEVDELKSAFVAYIRNPNDHKAVDRLNELSQKSANIVNTQSGQSGGHAVPEVISRDIARQVQNLSPIRQISRVVTVGTPDYKELVDLNGFGTQWVGELGTRNPTDTPLIAEVQPTMGELAALPEASRHALADVFFNVPEWLMDSASRQFAIAEGQAFVAGDGVNKPTGFLHGTPVATADADRAFGVVGCH